MILISLLFFTLFFILSIALLSAFHVGFALAIGSLLLMGLLLVFGLLACMIALVALPLIMISGILFSIIRPALLLPLATTGFMLYLVLCR